MRPHGEDRDVCRFPWLSHALLNTTLFRSPSSHATAADRRTSAPLSTKTTLRRSSGMRPAPLARLCSRLEPCRAAAALGLARSQFRAGNDEVRSARANAIPACPRGTSAKLRARIAADREQAEPLAGHIDELAHSSRSRRLLLSGLIKTDDRPFVAVADGDGAIKHLAVVRVLVCAGID